MIPFTRNRNGTIVAGFAPVEAELVVTLTSQLVALLSEVAGTGDDPLPGLVIGGSASVSDDPAIARLLPNAYADDESAAEFRGLTERGLAGRKIANARFVMATVGDGEVSLDDEGALRWMQAVGDLRLTIASRIGIVDDDSVLDDDDETLAMLDVYEWLAGVQDSLVRALDR